MKYAPIASMSERRRDMRQNEVWRNRYLSAGEIRQAAATLCEPLSQRRAWDIWTSRL